MELEVKALLSEEEYYNALETLHKDEYTTEHRHDTYYSQYPTMDEGKEAGEPCIRISKSSYGQDATPAGSKAFFTLKRKSLTPNGEEINEEYESEVSDASVIEYFLAGNGYKPLLTKEKEKCSGYVNIDDLFDVHCEVEKVGDKVYAIEIEYTGPINNSVDEGKGITKDRVMKALHLTLGQIFHIDPSRTDPRSWREILGINA